MIAQDIQGLILKKMPVDLVLLDNFRLNLLKHADLKMYDILQFGAFCGI